MISNGNMDEHGRGNSKDGILFPTTLEQAQFQGPQQHRDTQDKIRREAVYSALSIPENQVDSAEKISAYLYPMLPRFLNNIRVGKRNMLIRNRLKAEWPLSEHF